MPGFVLPCPPLRGARVLSEGPRWPPRVPRGGPAGTPRGPRRLRGGKSKKRARCRGGKVGGKLFHLRGGVDFFSTRWFSKDSSYSGAIKSPQVFHLTFPPTFPPRQRARFFDFSTRVFTGPRGVPRFFYLVGRHRRNGKANTAAKNIESCLNIFFKKKIHLKIHSGKKSM